MEDGNENEESGDCDVSNESSGDGNHQPVAFVYRTPEGLSNLDKRNVVLIDCCSSVEEIPQAAFAECDSLRQFRLSCSRLKSIGSLAFADCYCLEHLSPFPSTLLTIGFKAFSECCELKEVKLNEGLVRIEDEAFLMCEKFENVSIPSTVKFIGASCFQECTHLQFVEFRTNMDNIIIGDCAFLGCTSMTVARLPPSIQTLNRAAFRFCARLHTVELPLGLKHVREEAFEGCQFLMNIVIPSSVDPNGEDPFHDARSLTNLLFYPEKFNSRDSLSMQRGGFNSKPRAERIALMHEACVKRFYGYPIHEFCYKQSYLSLADALEGIEVALAAAPPDAVSLVDTPGMTVFHILALSSKPRIDLFQILHSRCPPRLAEMKDGCGKRPLDYLSVNSSVPPPARKVLLDYLAQITVLERASKLCLSKWRTAVIAEVQDELYQHSTRDTCKMYKVLEHYERSEILSLLELKIWHWKLQDREATGVEISRENKRPKVDERQVARVNCGADIIIANMLPFYGMEES